MFIEPNEHIIIMDMNDNLPERRLTFNEMLILKDAGVKTLYCQAAIRWEPMQPTPDAPFSWEIVDHWVDKARRAGLKMLIPFIYSIPPWKPDNFFFSREAVEAAYGVASYTNPEVSEELDDMIVKTIARYSGDDCQVVYSIPCNGELAFHLWTRDNQIHCDKDHLVKWVTDRQRLFEAQHGEIWTAYHPYTDPLYWNPIYDGLFAAFPDSKHYGIIFTYVQRNERHFFERIKANQDRGMIYYGGTEYIQGLRNNVSKLMKGNMRMFTAPKHPYQHIDKVDRWASDEIKWAIEQYNTDWVRW